jgi:hypothetical protein
MGEQIANNRTMHGNIQLYENEQGEYYPVVEWDDTPKLVRGEYHPIGSRFQYPRNWGKRKGATILLEQRIEDVRKQIEDAQLDLDKLQACLEKVQLWDSTEK